MIHESKLFNPDQILFPPPQCSPWFYAESKKKKNTVTALEVQNPSEKIGTAITEPAPSYTQELCVKRFFLSNNSSMNAHKPPTQVIIYCTEEDPLLFCVPIALVCIILL